PGSRGQRQLPDPVSLGPGARRHLHPGARVTLGQPNGDAEARGDEGEGGAQASGRAPKAMISASSAPSSQTLRPSRLPRSTVSPSATNTTISARLASEVWKRPISPLYGALLAPTNRPATKTARKPEPCATEATP